MPVIGSPARREAPRRRVRVLEVRPENSFAICQDSQFGRIHVSYDLSQGSLSTVPAKGQEWYVEKISEVWYFDRQSPVANKGLARARKSEPGDTVLEADNELLLYDKHGKFPNRKEFEDLADQGYEPPSIPRPLGMQASYEYRIPENGIPVGDVKVRWETDPGNYTFQVWVLDYSLPENERDWVLAGNFEGSPALISGMKTNTKYGFKVRAQSTAGYLSEFSTSVDLTIPTYVLVPKTPTLPKVDTSAMFVFVSWDGKMFDGTLPHGNVRGVEVSISKNINDKNVLATLAPGGSFSSRIDTKTTYFVTSRAVTNDPNLNSPWTEPVMAYAEGITDSDLNNTSIDEKIREVYEELKPLSTADTVEANAAITSQDAADRARKAAENELRDAPERQPNGDFEYDLKDWEITTSGPITTGSPAAKDGTRGLILGGGGALRGVEHAITGSSHWIMRFWYRTESGQTGAPRLEAGVAVDAPGKNNEFVNTRMTPSVLGNTAGLWQEVIIHGTSPSVESGVVYPGFVSTSGGPTIHIDDVYFKDATSYVALEDISNSANDLALQSHVLAGSAKDNAGIAFQDRDSESWVYHGDTSPAGVGEYLGDLWYKHEESLYGRVIGKWTWTSVGWVRAELSSEVFDNVQVGQIVAGGAKIGAAAIQQLWADGVGINVLRSNRAYITAPNLLSGESFQTVSEVHVDGSITDRGEIHYFSPPGNLSFKNASKIETTHPLQMVKGTEYLVTFRAKSLSGTTTLNFSVPSGVMNPSTVEVGPNEEEFELSFKPVVGITDSNVLPTDFVLTISNLNNIEVDVKDMIFRPKMGGRLIVDGDIQARHVDFESLAADDAAMNTLRTGIVTVGSVPESALQTGTGNLLHNGNFEVEVFRRDFPLGDGVEYTQEIVRNGDNALKINTGTSPVSHPIGHWIEVDSGELLSVSWWGRAIDGSASLVDIPLEIEGSGELLYQESAVDESQLDSDDLDAAASIYHKWEGTEDNSTSLRISEEEILRNILPNPRLKGSTGEVTSSGVEEDTIDHLGEESAIFSKSESGGELYRYFGPDINVPGVKEWVPGVSYIWEGRPHESETIKFIDGKPVARNLVINGDFENDTYGWEYNAPQVSSFSTVTQGNTQMWGGLGGRLAQIEVSQSTRYSDIQQTFDVPVEEGQWVGFSANVATREDMSVRAQITWRTETGALYSSSGWLTDAIFYEGGRIHSAFQAPANAHSFRVQIQVDKVSGEAGKTFWVDKVSVTLCDTEAEALEHTSTYFDGSTVPGQEGSVYRWEGTPGNSVSIESLEGLVLSRNLVTTPSFEYGIGVWSTPHSDVVTTREFVPASRGLWGGFEGTVLKMTPPSTRGRWDIDSDRIPVVADQWLSFAADLYASDNSTNVFHVMWFNSSNTRLSIDSVDVGGLNQSVRAQGVFQAPSGTTYAVLRPSYRGNAASGRYGYINRVHAAVASTRTDAQRQTAEYFDGDSSSSGGPSGIKGDVWLTVSVRLSATEDRMTKVLLGHALPSATFTYVPINLSLVSEDGTLGPEVGHIAELSPSEYRIYSGVIKLPTGSDRMRVLTYLSDGNATGVDQDSENPNAPADELGIGSDQPGSIIFSAISVIGSPTEEEASEKVGKVFHGNSPRVFPLSGTGQVPSIHRLDPLVSDQWQHVSRVVTIPQGVRRVRPSVVSFLSGGDVFIDDVTVMRSMTERDRDGRRADLTPQGLELFGEDGSKTVSLTSTPPDFISIEKDGGTVFSVDESGKLFAEEVSSEQDMEIGGTKLLGRLMSETQGDDSYLDWLPRGVLVAGNIIQSRTSYSANFEYGVARASFPVIAGRYYRVSVDAGHVVSTSTNPVVRVRHRYNATPTFSSSALLSGYISGPGTGASISSKQPLVDILRATSTGTLHLFVTIKANSAFTRHSTDGTRRTTILVEDVGGLAPATVGADTSYLNASGGSSGSSTPTKTKRTTTWSSNNHRIYRSTGSSATGIKSSLLQYLIQGPLPGVTTTAHRSIATFPSMTSTLSGATINKVEVYIRFAHWYQGSGGTTALYLHGQSSPSSSFPSVRKVGNYSFKRGQGRWITIPSSLYTPIRNGTYRGIAIIGGTGYSNYGYAYGPGSSSRPKIRVTYTK